MNKVIPFKCHICQKTIEESPVGLNVYTTGYVCHLCNQLTCYRHIRNKIAVLFSQKPICKKCFNEKK